MTVPVNEQTDNVTTRMGIPIAVATTHTGGVGGSPSKGCFEYEAKAKAKAKAKSKKSSRKK